jgi:acetyltransferase-like isoleucine patch superfamily enzyme
MLQITEPLFLSQPRNWEEFDVRIGAFVVLEGAINHPIRIGRGCRIGHHSYVAPGVVLGENVAIDTMSYIGSGTMIGDGSAVHSVKVFEQITIGRNSFIGGEVSNWTRIGDDVTFMGRIVHTYRKAGSRDDWIGSEPKPSPRIGNRAVIGENAMLIGGVEIGEGAYVSAGEIVKCDVPAEHLAIGGRLVPLALFRGFIQSRR